MFIFLKFHTVDLKWRAPGAIFCLTGLFHLGPICSSPLHWHAPWNSFLRLHNVYLWNLLNVFVWIKYLCFLLSPSLLAWWMDFISWTPSRSHLSHDVDQTLWTQHTLHHGRYYAPYAGFVGKSYKSYSLWIFWPFWNSWHISTKINVAPAANWFCRLLTQIRTIHQWIQSRVSAFANR